ncbi:hypothetical protein LB543_24315 [Mesorhizobium sp. ESP7-2]|uniref:hypothetical protein n=1 Tax=Mesorhizobium sp. ESP7-2 TaxID=2876622 RepID=UPI001CCF43B7|nr:hypothetical protein [Mesorhizobium sp. ESP7-2]MBZ9709837.1 hypothetical protein [Mesorhizobium sp. ESP7-2]
MKSPSMATPLPRAVARKAGASAAVSCGTFAARAVTEDCGLWARSTPEAIARAAHDLFGTDAAQAIEWCALSASNAHREADLRFWRAVKDLLDAPAADGKAVIHPAKPSLRGGVRQDPAEPRWCIKAPS